MLAGRQSCPPASAAGDMAARTTARKRPGRRDCRPDRSGPRRAAFTGSRKEGFGRRETVKDEAYQGIMHKKNEGIQHGGGPRGPTIVNIASIATAGPASETATCMCRSTCRQGAMVGRPPPPRRTRGEFDGDGCCRRPRLPVSAHERPGRSYHSNATTPGDVPLRFRQASPPHAIERPTASQPRPSSCRRSRR